MPIGVPIDLISANGSIAKLVSGNTVSCYHTDALGSTRIVTGANGHVTFSDGYQPFGQDNETPTGSETHNFTGKPYSHGTGCAKGFRIGLSIRPPMLP